MGEQKKTQEPDLNQLKKVRREKLADLQANGKNPFEITKYDVTCHAADVKDNYEEMEGKHVTLAGRIMQKRVMGKASSVTFWIRVETFSLMLQETALEKKNTKISRRWISEIS